MDIRVLEFRSGQLGFGIEAQSDEISPTLEPQSSMPLDDVKYAIPVGSRRLDRLVFHLEHALLSPGRSDVARLRGYLRLKAWRGGRTVGARLHALKVAVKLPARAAREAWRSARERGALVERETGVSRHRQALHLWWLWVRHGVNDPRVYYAFRLYRPGQLRRAPNFLQQDEDDDLFRLLNLREARADAELLLDKVAFERWLVLNNFPTVRTLVEFVGGKIVGSTLGPDGPPSSDLFVKPNDGLQGFGAESWIFTGSGWTGPRGHRTADELFAELQQMSRLRRLIVQEKLRNHPALAPLAPCALSTVRVLTLRTLDGSVQVVLAVAKIPTGTSPTDHLRLGGVAAQVDLATGRLGTGIRKNQSLVIEPCTHHPDTGVAISGFTLPLWKNVLDLAVRAHEALPAILCVGWDVAILRDGPLIIEGNDNPGHSSSQLPTGIGLGETPVLSALRECLRRSFARPYASREDGREPYLPPAPNVQDAAI